MVNTQETIIKYLETTDTSGTLNHWLQIHTDSWHTFRQWESTLTKTGAHIQTITTIEYGDYHRSQSYRQYNMWSNWL